MSAGCVSGQLPVPGAGREEQGPAATPPGGGAGSTGRARVERLVTSGTFSLDGGTWQVENNVWIVGDDEQCVVIDPAHDAAAVTAAVGDTGRSHSDFGTIIESIRTRLLTLPPATEVLTGHGEPTTVGAEAPHLQEWIDRGL